MNSLDTGKRPRWPELRWRQLADVRRIPRSAGRAGRYGGIVRRPERPLFRAVDVRHHCQPDSGPDRDRGGDDIRADHRRDRSLRRFGDGAGRGGPRSGGRRLGLAAAAGRGARRAGRARLRLGQRIRHRQMVDPLVHRHARHAGDRPGRFLPGDELADQVHRRGDRCLELPDGLGLSPAFLVAVAVVLAGQFLLSRTVFGRYMVAIGTNEQAVRLSGINPSLRRSASSGSSVCWRDWEGSFRLPGWLRPTRMRAWAWNSQPSPRW